MAMSKAQAQKNRETLRLKRERLPEVTTTYLTERVRPDDFAKAFKNIPFAYVPIHDLCYWCFTSRIDVELFNAWRGSQ